MHLQSKQSTALCRPRGLLMFQTSPKAVQVLFRVTSRDLSDINFHLISRSLHQKEEDSAPTVYELSVPLEYSRKDILCKNLPKYQQTTKDIT